MLARGRAKCTSGDRWVIRPARVWPQALPSQQFHVRLTPFPRCFSSFDHSTCALSVSGRYLALEGIYLPLGAAFPNCSTLRGSFAQAAAPDVRGSHPLRRPVPGDSGGAFAGSILSKLQLGPPRGGPDFKFGLLPLHSPLLGQSLLVSFPPLIDMLKFSGYSYLIRGQGRSAAARATRARPPVGAVRRRSIPARRKRNCAGRRGRPGPPMCLRARGELEAPGAAPTPGRPFPPKGGRPEWCPTDARTGMPAGMPAGAMCVQKFDDSLEFCNSHYLSHFAAFFIDARTKRSVAESCG